jgi:tetratricopeptide (TPR) repeat protein
VYSNLGDTERAFADYDTAIRLSPQNSDAYLSRGNAFQSRGEYDRAIADYTKAIRRTSRTLTGGASRKINLSFQHQRRATAHLAKGNLDLAIADYSRSIELSPKSGFAHGAPGDYKLKGDFQRAIADYNEMILIDSTDGEDTTVLGFVKRAAVHLALGEFDEAIVDYDEAVELSPSSQWLILRADAHRNQGDEDRAVADYDAAIAMANLQLEPAAEDDEDTESSREGAKFRRAYAYMWRGIAKHRKSDLQGSAADTAQAQAIRAGIAGEFAAWLGPE